MIKRFFWDWVILMVVFGAGALVGQQTVHPFSQLTRISDREYVNLDKVSFVRLPITTPVPDCPECTPLRWGANLVVDGANADFSTEADQKVRELLRDARQ